MKKILFLSIIVLFFACDRIERSDAYGNFEVIDITVSSEANGKILQLEIEEGDLLQKGQLIGQIDTIALYLKKKTLKMQKLAIKTRIANLESQVRVQQQQLENFETDNDRFEKMYKDGAATQKQLDDINGRIDLVNEQINSIQVQKVGILAEMETVETQVDQLDDQLKKCSITNPVTGTVLSKYANTGELAGIGKPLYKIADMSQLDLKVYISGDQLPHVKIGQEVQVLIDDTRTTNRELKGKITWISHQAEFTPKTIQTKEERVNLVYAAKVRVLNDGSLKIGMPGEVNFNY